MKALELVEYNHLEYRDAPEPDLAEDEVLVKEHAVGICGSDVHGQEGSNGRRIPTVITGHEAAGEAARWPTRVVNTKDDELWPVVAELTEGRGVRSGSAACTRATRA